MSLLLAPVLAQLVTLGLSDRTEARLIVSEESDYVEGSTAPGVSLGFAWRRATLTVGYSPYVTITPPGPEPRELTVFHTVTAAAQYQYQWRRTTLRLIETASYGQHDYRAELLAPRSGPGVVTPAPGADPGTGLPSGGNTGAGMTPGTATPSTPATPGSGGAGGPVPAQPRRASDLVVHYGSSTTTAALTHQLSRRVSLDATGSYLIGGGLDEASRAPYPIVQGPQGVFTVTQRIARRDSIFGQLASQYAFSDDGVRSWVSGLNAGWLHGFDARTSLSLTAGSSLTWTELIDDTETLSIYPVLGVGLTHATRPRNGTFTFALNATSAPFVDMTTAEVDPRVAVTGNVIWVRDRLTLGASLSSAISLSDDSDDDALNTITAAIHAAYALGAGFSIDGGARAAWQTVGQETVLPPSWALFLGVTWAAELPLN